MKLLHRYLDDAVARFPERVAVREASGAAIGYRKLGQLSDRLRDRLIRMGVEPEDRVGIYLRKSIDTVASIFGVLKSGAAYVPVDPSAPATRNGYILGDCSVRAVITESRFATALKEQLNLEGVAPQILLLDDVGGGKGLKDALDAAQALDPAAAGATVDPEVDALAYILYTSGSTGKPKGVMISHRNASSFVSWCGSVFEPTPADVFSSHAPFHFDLSILDIYTSLGHGATLVLVPEDVGKEPQKLARLITETKMTVWYSTPSILSLLVQYGKLETRDLSSLRLVLFAGEVFPIVHLRALHAILPRPRYFNLYGPTETNVCTFYELPREFPADRKDPFPIGVVCSHLEGKVVDEAGREVDEGEEGELCIRGESVTPGYWNLPEQTARAYLDLDGSCLDLPANERWYETGDLVVEEADGNYTYVGRKDRMVKKRGYRVELGEIESCLYRHPEVREVAVVAIPDDETGLKVRAHLATRDGGRLSLIQLKSFCSQHLPVYMIPDVFSFHEELPKTSTDKTDYQTLMKMG